MTRRQVPTVSRREALPRGYDGSVEGPRIVVTLGDPTASADPALARLKNQAYLDALERAGATAIPLRQ